jgi:hypothetical protein
MQIYNKLAGITDPFKPISAGIRPLANYSGVSDPIDKISAGPGTLQNKFP